MLQKVFKNNYFCRENIKEISILGKIRDIFHGQHRKFAWFVTVTTSVFVFLWIVGPGNTVIHWAKAGLEIRRQEKVIREYELQNAGMDRRVNMLKTDKDTLEKFAREQFHFAAPGEDVYVID